MGLPVPVGKEETRRVEVALPPGVVFVVGAGALVEVVTRLILRAIGPDVSVNGRPRQAPDTSLAPVDLEDFLDR